MFKKFINCNQTGSFFNFIIIIVVVVVVVVELTDRKTILENTVEIEPQPIALHFKNLSQYSSCSK